jgi:hypothetical protein
MQVNWPKEWHYYLKIKAFKVESDLGAPAPSVFTPRSCYEGGCELKIK